jgi:hypothetical protein
MHMHRKQKFHGRDGIGGSVSRALGLQRRRGRMALSFAVALALAVFATLAITGALPQAAALAEGGPVGPPGPGGDPPPPVEPLQIIHFEGEQTWGDLWLFTGEVANYEPLSGLNLKFGGFGEGKTAKTNSQGAFAVEIEIPRGSQGMVSAWAYAPSGETSEVVERFVST